MANVLRVFEEQGTDSLRSIVRGAALRLAKSSDPFDAKKLFTAKERAEVADLIASASATGELMGRAALRLRAKGELKKHAEGEGQPCGESHISPDKECRIGQGASRGKGPASDENLRKLTRESGNIEHAIIVDREGNPLTEIQAGQTRMDDGFTRQSVSLPTTAEMPDGVVHIHTHPRNAGPSKADIRAFYSDQKIASARIVEPDGTWIMTKSPDFEAAKSGYEITEILDDIEASLIVDEKLDWHTPQFKRRLYDKFEQETGIAIHHKPLSTRDNENEK